MAAVRRWLLAGLLVLVPLAITIWVLDWIVGTLDQTLQILPLAWRPDHLIGFHIPGFGVLLALAIVLTIGAVASNFLGKKLVGWWDALLGRIPIVRSIYSTFKQDSGTWFSENGNAFRKALLIHWPREASALQNHLESIFRGLYFWALSLPCSTSTQSAKPVNC